MLDLMSALEVLCRVHTQDDDEVGFTVRIGERPYFSYDVDNYAAAWAALRALRKVMRGEP